MFTPEAYLGMLRSLRATLLRREVVVAGACRRCGECCRNLLLHVPGGPLRHAWQFEQTCRELPEYRRFRIAGQTADGLLLFACDRLRDNQCRDYSGRLAFCKTYPSTSTYFLGHDLLPGCGFHFEEKRRGQPSMA